MYNVYTYIYIYVTANMYIHYSASLGVLGFLVDYPSKSRFSKTDVL